MENPISFEDHHKTVELAPGLVPDWETQKEVLLVWPERLRAGIGRLKPFYKAFINQLTERINVRLIINPELDSRVIHSYFNDPDKITISKVNLPDIWLRDFMPLVQRPIYGRSGIKPLYAPAYLREKDEIFATEGNNGAIILSELMQIKLDIAQNSFGLPLILDGGNITVNGKETAICTNRIISDNETWSLQQIEDSFIRKLGITKLILLPCEPGDATGHIDGMVRFIDQKTVAVGAYSDGFQKMFMDTVAQTITDQGFDVLRIKNVLPPGPEKEKTISSAYGNFINYFRVGNTIYLPQYSTLRKEFAEAEKAFQEFGIEVIAVPEVDELSSLGGVLNCITWNI